MSASNTPTTTGSSNYTIFVWWDEEWGRWFWHSDTDGGVL